MNSRQVALTIVAAALLWLPCGAEEGRAGCRVTVRNDRTILVNGEPFFPIGLYYAFDELQDESGAQLRELRAMGFNTIFHGGGMESGPVLDRIAAAGLRAWFRPPGALNSQFDEMKKVVSIFRSHPAVLFWEEMDEPVGNELSFDDTKKGYDLVRQIDPDHPVMCNQWADVLDTNTLARWGTVSDVYCFDFYPVPLARWILKKDRLLRGLSHSIAVMGEYTDIFQSVVPGKPVIAVCQAWSWSPLKYGKAGYPTREEGRFMPYQCIVHGAKGIFFYGQVRTTRPNTANSLPEQIDPDPAKAKEDFAAAVVLNTWFWSYFRDVVLEMGQMSPVFAAGDADWKPDTRAKSIRMLVKQYGDTPVILAVNESGKAVDAEITAVKLAGRKVHRWFSGGELSADGNGTFSDTFEGFGVRIYSTASSVTAAK